MKQGEVENFRYVNHLTPIHRSLRRRCRELRGLYRRVICVVSRKMNDNLGQRFCPYVLRHVVLCMRTGRTRILYSGQWRSLDDIAAYKINVQGQKVKGKYHKVAKRIRRIGTNGCVIFKLIGNYHSRGNTYDIVSKKTYG